MAIAVCLLLLVRRRDSVPRIKGESMKMGGIVNVMWY